LRIWTFPHRILLRFSNDAVLFGLTHGDWLYIYLCRYFGKVDIAVRGLSYSLMVFETLNRRNIVAWGLSLSLLAFETLDRRVDKLLVFEEYRSAWWC
jgi:hypothetical protein